MRVYTKIAALLLVLVYANCQALIIHNQNTYPIKVESVDKGFNPPAYSLENCRISGSQVETTSDCYEIATTETAPAKHVCETITSQPVTCTNRNDYAIFKLITDVSPKGVISLYESNYLILPKHIDLKIYGATGDVQTTVKNSCELTVHNKGWMKGIYIEYGPGC